MKYTQVPDWLKKQHRDPFEYPLRSKAEVQEEQKYFPPDFQWRVSLSRYPAGDIRENEPGRVDHRDKKARFDFDFADMGLSP